MNVEKTNRVLLVAAILLLALSAFTFRSSVQRADRFERGQKFLPTLDLDSVAEIVLREGSEGGTKEVVLRRTAEGDRFVVQSAHGYRADNSEVNRLLRKFLDLKLEKEVGEATGDLAEGLAVAAPGDEGPADGTVEIALRDAADQDVVRFLLGSEFNEEGASGRYLRRLGSTSNDAADGTADTIYLTQGRVDLELESDSYVDQEILDVERDQIVAIRGDGFAFVREVDEEGQRGELVLEGLGEDAKESSEARTLKGVLSPLRFASHHLANAQDVVGLVFDKSLQIELADGSGYVLELARQESAEDDSKAFLRIHGFHTTEQVYIDRDASEDEVRETSELLERANEVAAFTEYHGSWIYEVTSTVADRVGVDASGLVDES
ncbi:MAG: DUF4340 domain-containing protein [Thermoanaerobaculia bacterium]|nr:DUF4340 domain-containing protein [Thermoanaerobaculia bacterium]